LENYDIIVVGAGASGLIAASRAAELGARVLVLEKKQRAGNKLLITGKGRCNITNTASLSEYYSQIQPRGKFLKHAFASFFTEDIIDLLNKEGVSTVVERGGRVFPESNSAKDVLQALLNHALRLGVSFWYNSSGCALHQEDGHIKGVRYFQKGKEYTVTGRSVILTTGGKSYPATGSEGDGYDLARSVGHTMADVRPALVPLETQGEVAKRLQGLTLKNAKAVVWVNGKKATEEFGELLFTHFGLSGPIVLTLSRIVVDDIQHGNSVSLSIDLKPALDEKKLDNRLLRDLEEHAKKHVENIAPFWFPKKLIPVFFERTGIDPQKEGHQITSKERKRMKMFMKEFTLQIKGPRSFKEAIITAGGVPTTEIDSKTLRSKLIDNLYFAGEVIDLDANTGGYNLQIAWSTGWLAGESSAVALGYGK